MGQMVRTYQERRGVCGKEHRESLSIRQKKERKTREKLGDKSVWKKSEKSDTLRRPVTEAPWKSEGTPAHHQPWIEHTGYRKHRTA
ncbi:hypothetical protein E2C01_035602 [Portunus trituberculatus]|uniref:Uncharacterized protein n=1 Tax=Portunus trituberculatus TaxID=210409 RepID=A0A5B7F3K8_PORTR|nr:hypothetical protein [Portunus trituberculatus]